MIQYVPRVGGFVWCVTEVLSVVMIRVNADSTGRCQLLGHWFAVGAGFEWMDVDLSPVARRPLTSALISFVFFWALCTGTGPRGSCRQIAYMIYEHFRATGAYEAAQGLSDLYNIQLLNDDVQDFDTRWDQALLAASEMPTEMVLESSYKSKLQDPVQLQTALALYEQEDIRNDGQQSYSRLKTSVRLQESGTKQLRVGR